MAPLIRPGRYRCRSCGTEFTVGRDLAGRDTVAGIAWSTNRCKPGCELADLEQLARTGIIRLTVVPLPLVRSDSFTCPRCRRTSYHPSDVAQGYCGACGDWTRR